MKIDVTEEQYKAFQNGESITLVPPKKEHVIEYDRPYFTQTNYKIDQSIYKIISGNAFDNGVYRKTKDNAEYSKKRNQRANRLEALVEDLQGELGVGDSYIYYRKDDDKYKYRRDTNANETYSEMIFMKNSTAEKICELLNSEQYSLEY